MFHIVFLDLEPFIKKSHKPRLNYPAGILLWCTLQRWELGQNGFNTLDLTNTQKNDWLSFKQTVQAQAHWRVIIEVLAAHQLPVESQEGQNLWHAWESIEGFWNSLWSEIIELMALDIVCKTMASPHRCLHTSPRIQVAVEIKVVNCFTLLLGHYPGFSRWMQYNHESLKVERRIGRENQRTSNMRMIWPDDVGFQNGTMLWKFVVVWS